MTTLVTGARGFLGRAVVARLRAQGTDVIPTARTAGRDARCLDLADPRGMLAVLDEARPTAVVHCGAVVDPSGDAVAPQFAVNVLAPAIVASWCARHDAYLVHLSTITVCGAKALLVEASTPAAPDTAYGQAKHLAELLVVASGARAAVLRMAGIYGLDGPAHLGLNGAIASARKGELPTIVGRGQARRTYVAVEDAAAAVAACLDAQLLGLYAVGSREVLTIGEMVRLVTGAFLAGREPRRVEGAEATDQIVVPSELLPAGRPMGEVLREYARRAPG